MTVSMEERAREYADQVMFSFIGDDKLRENLRENIAVALVRFATAELARVPHD